MQQPIDLRPTFVITRDGDVDLYKTVADAASYMEAVDVRDGEYEAVFSLEGELLEIVLDEDQVSIVATGAVALSTLRDRLRVLAERNGYDGEDPDPRDVANEVFAAEWRARWPRWPRWLDRLAHGDGPPVV